MSSLWTPSGEHRVPRPGGGDPAGGDGPAGDDAPPVGGPPPRRSGAADDQGSGGDVAHGGQFGDDEEEAAARAQLDKLRQQVLSAPAEDVVANHAYGLFELAAIHLSAERPSLPAARLAIDALGALVEGLGDRLGASAGGLRDGLSQLRLAFVKIAEAVPAGDGGAPTTPAAAPASPPPAAETATADGDAGAEPADDATPPPRGAASDAPDDTGAGTEPVS